MSENRARPVPGDAEPALRVSYIIGSYPVLTETFIDREILQVIARGVDLAIVSIRQPGPNLSPAQQTLARRVRYLLPPFVPALLWAHVAAAVRRPSTYFGTLAWLLSRPHAKSRLRTFFHWGTGVYAAWALRDRRGIHIHAHFVDRAATVALVASRLLDTTYSVTAHAREIYVEPVLLPERISNASFAVTCTEYNRRHLIRVVGPEVGERIVRLYHGVDFGPFAQAAHGRRRGDANLLAVAQLMERKGLRYLIDACDLLSRSGRNVRCDIVGDGPLLAELNEQVKRLGLEGSVTLRGPLSFPEVVALYGTASAFVLPCIVAPDGDRDGIPNVILEAMAAGLPVISTPVSGIPEVVQDGETGLLVPEADAGAISDAVDRVLSEDGLAARLGANARAFVLREFDLERNVGVLLDRFALARDQRPRVDRA
jgi:glycosyltransferase involved in cell wall biosynthesis